MSQSETTRRILRRPQVEAFVGLSRSTLYRLITAGDFPRPVRLGPQSVGWLKSEIDDWIASRRAKRDAQQERIEAIQAKLQAGARP